MSTEVPEPPAALRAAPGCSGSRLHEDVGDGGQNGVEDEAVDIQLQGIGGSPRIIEHGAGEHAKGIDRRECSGVCALDDDQAHGQGADAEPQTKRQGNGSDDRDGGRRECPRGGECRSQEEHQDGNEHLAVTGETFGPVGEQVNGAVDPHDSEEQGGTDEDEEQARRELADDVLDGHAHQKRADAEGGDEGKESGVDPGERTDGKGRYEDEERDEG
ncbi:hypothetical protein JOE40_002293 [Arthrobacter sp. PvP102]|nr:MULTISPECIES: hypothetical protein [unclassified Arthrobacter]MBP1232649.1 hypothetical protein [Arthrobacter sp. PvP103]MBP1237784.1 hypothetical protein [Arthrobacter sp. PvP102]